MNVIHGYDHVPLNARGRCSRSATSTACTAATGLLDRVVEKAGELHAVPAVMIFEPHPREFFHPEEPHFRLTRLNEKLRLLDRSGIKVAVVVPFNAQLAAMGAAEFIERVLVAGLGVRHVVIGYDFFFGNRRSGTPETMRLAGEELGFGVSVMAPVREGGEVFSSTAIRLKLVQGDVRGAADALGHWWRISGRSWVVPAAARARVPDGNLALPPGTALAHGIYAVRAFVGDGRTKVPLTSARDRRSTMENPFSRSSFSTSTATSTAGPWTSISSISSGPIGASTRAKRCSGQMREDARQIAPDPGRRSYSALAERAIIVVNFERGCSSSAASWSASDFGATCLRRGRRPTGPLRSRDIRARGARARPQRRTGT